MRNTEILPRIENPLNKKCMAFVQQMEMLRRALELSRMNEKSQRVRALFIGLVCHPPRNRLLTRKHSGWTLLSHGVVDDISYFLADVRRPFYLLE
jgi:hypothetical protein